MVTQNLIDTWNTECRIAKSNGSDRVSLPSHAAAAPIHATHASPLPHPQPPSIGRSLHISTPLSPRNHLQRGRIAYPSSDALPRCSTHAPPKHLPFYSPHLRMLPPSRQLLATAAYLRPLTTPWLPTTTKVSPLLFFCWWMCLISITKRC